MLFTNSLEITYCLTVLYEHLSSYTDVSTQVGKIGVQWWIYNSCLLTAIDGGWSTFTGWSDCSTPCGDGTQTRSRVCDNPEPDHGGKPCEGNSTQTRTCNEKHCGMFTTQTLKIRL